MPLVHDVVQWYQNTLSTGGYPLIVGLMAAESTIVPIPSETIIPFAAHLGHTTGQFSFWGVVIAGTVGSFVGAAIMYWVSRWAGRPLVLRYGKFFLVPEKKLIAAEQWSKQFGAFGVFAARLLPVVRHLIGIPMGIVKMDFRWYALFTLIGSAVWCTVLAWVGIVAGDNLKGDMRHITLWIVGALAILGALYYFLVHRFMTKPAKEL